MSATQALNGMTELRKIRAHISRDLPFERFASSADPSFVTMVKPLTHKR